MKRNAIGLCAAGLAVVFALGACGSGSDPAEEEPASEETTEEEGVGPAQDEYGDIPDVLDFAAPTIDGDILEGASLMGDPTVLWFWEHDCPVCQSQGGTVSGLADEYGDQIDIVGVSGAGLYATSSDEDRSEFVSQTGTEDLVHLADEDYALRTDFGVVSQSTFVVLDSEGTEVDSGSLSEEDLNAAVASAL